MPTIKKQLNKLPKSPGVYIFRDKGGKIIYIGKATNLKSRVNSYFTGQRGSERPIETMMHKVASLGVQKTDSVLEALILEANLIKKYQPEYNVLGKDDKSFAYFVITREEFPRVLILRETELAGAKVKKIYGPYTSKRQMEVALRIIRKIFPFHSVLQKSEKGCLDFQMGRCPGPYAGEISKKDYQKNIRGIQMILEGKKKSLLQKMKKEMEEYAREEKFEKAQEAKHKIFALNHVQDVALMTGDDGSQFTIDSSRTLRIEAYDVSNISGQQAVGSMVVFKNEKTDKSQYRKFKIKTVAGADDVGMMREVLSRRFQNPWTQPDLILLDGGKGHLNMAQKLLRDLGLIIPLVAVAKGPTRKKLDLYVGNYALSKEIHPMEYRYAVATKSLFHRVNNILGNETVLKRIMDEAHRFAISYHKKVRRREFI